jgi:hypothetical protein
VEVHVLDMTSCTCLFAYVESLDHVYTESCILGVWTWEMASIGLILYDNYVGGPKYLTASYADGGWSHSPIPSTARSVLSWLVKPISKI